MTPNPDGSTGVIIPKIVKFTLPDFNINDPKTWFSAVDHIFEANGVRTEAEKFSQLLQYLDGQQLTNICDIIGNTVDQTKYSSAKDRLISVHGQTRSQEITSLLKDTQVEEGMKPTIVLTKLKNLAGPNFDKDLLREIWQKKLPPRIREIVSACGDTLEKQAEIADRVHECYEKTPQASAVAAATTTQTSDVSQNASMDVMFAMLKNLQVQVSEIQRDSRSRQRSPTPYRNRRRSSSRARSGPQMFNNVCWYHHTFQNRARKCAPGCTYSSKNE